MKLSLMYTMEMLLLRKPKQLSHNFFIERVSLYTMSLSDGNYCTSADVAEMNGFSHHNMKIFGKEMTEGEYELFVSDLCTAASELVNRWCNVDTFYEHTIEDEYHTMDTSDYYFYPDYIPSVYGYAMGAHSPDHNVRKRTILPRDYPVMNITKVEANRATNYGAPVWMTLKPPAEDAYGDYQIVRKFKSTKITIIRNAPLNGLNNSRMSYTAGYPETDKVFTILKRATAMIVNNYLNYKAKMQEASTLRQSAVQDYAAMFDPEYAKYILTDDIKSILELYRRPPVDPTAYA